MPEFDMEGYLAAMRAKDQEAILRFFADDVEVRDAGMEQPVVQGKGHLARMLRESLPALGDVDLRATYVVHEGGRMAAFLEGRVRYERDVPLPGGVLPVRGKSLDAEVGVFAELDGQGRIRRAVRVRDLWSLARQLGLRPEQLDRILAASVPTPPG